MVMKTMYSKVQNDETILKIYNKSSNIDSIKMFVHDFGYGVCVNISRAVIYSGFNYTLKDKRLQSFNQ